MKQAKPSEQIIHINQGNEGDLANVRDGYSTFDKVKGRLLTNVRLVTLLAVHITKHGDTWDNCDENLLSVIESPLRE